jgi:hypothetical protein
MAEGAPSPSPGRNKSFRTCKAEFDNRPNSRGFPHVPWIYFALTYTDRSDKNDGESMN